jgi:hypothetical protein
MVGDMIDDYLESSTNLPINDYGSISHPEIGTGGMVKLV